MTRTNYKLTATKNRKEVSEVVTGIKNVYNWQTLYKRNGYTVTDVSPVR